MSSERTEVSFQVAKNCMELIKNGSVNDAFESLGISDDDFHLCCDSIPWIGSDRTRVSAVLNTLTHGVLDVLGLPRIEVPAEYRAGIITTFCAPGNIAVACRWLETGPTAENLSFGGSLESVTAQKLFGLCCMLYGLAPAGQAQWRKRTGRALRDVIGDAQPLEAKSDA